MTVGYPQMLYHSLSDIDQARRIVKPLDTAFDFKEIAYDEDDHFDVLGLDGQENAP